MCRARYIFSLIPSSVLHTSYAVQLSAVLAEDHLLLCQHSLTSSLSALLTHTAALVTLSNRHSKDVEYIQLQATITAM